MKKQKNYFLGLDIGTDSVGYAAVDETYSLMKYAGEAAWGTTVFDEALLKTDRRAFRTARRRLDRRQQRVQFIRELFAKEIAKVDENFYRNIQASGLFREDVDARHPLFNDSGFTDAEYYQKYPTIHHLLHALMTEDEPFDVRLVYLAIAWLTAHRGHFLYNISVDNLSEIKDFNGVYNKFMAFFSENEMCMPWDECNPDALADILRKKEGVTQKNKELTALLYNGKKPSKEATEEFPYSRDAIVSLLAGRSVKTADLFCNEAYADFGKVILSEEDEKLEELSANIGDDFELIAVMRAIYDWTVLVEVLDGEATVSAAKVKTYNRHHTDLENLKYILKKYVTAKKYNEVFSDGTQKANYAAYAKHPGKSGKLEKTANKEDFSKYILAELNKITPDAEDAELLSQMKKSLEYRTFLPKQKTSDNRVIPHQLYEYELNVILAKAEKYLPFLTEKEEGTTVSEKIKSVFRFRIPYFVGPLNSHSEYAWIQFKGEKKEKITPWNFENIVDLDKSEEAFINKLTNTCTYLPGEPVLPKDSLLYHRFTVLNAINNIKIDNNPISISQKQRIYNEVFLNKKKVTKKYLCQWFIENHLIDKGNNDTVTGIDDTINADLVPQIAFRRLLQDNILTEDAVEDIINHSAFSNDKTRLAKWLTKNYPHLSAEDRKYICAVKCKDFGRLSRKFLTEIFACVDKATGEAVNIIDAMWITNNNLMELLSDKYGFIDAVREENKLYYNGKTVDTNTRLDEMYISNSVKRSVFRSLAIVNDVVKAFGVPEKIFIETTRGATEEQKNKRTKSRKDQLLELYAMCRDEDVRICREQLEAMGDTADNRLQSEKLFLYYLQLGKCMYSGKTIELDKLSSNTYNVDHIFPQAYVKDDSILNNKVLVLSTVNGQKSDIYPIQEEIRTKMFGYWTALHEKKLINDEKYKRLTRSTGFSDDEKYGFINRQLVETSQASKAVATLLHEKYPDTKIVYCKAKLASEFRQEFDILKSRKYNELHHAVDAYLNVVTGNVYNEKFTSRWFNVHNDYSVKTKTLFTHPLILDGKTIWDNNTMLPKVLKTATKNTAHFTVLQHFKTGGLFDQMPVSAQEGLVPRKANLPTEKYGGYNKSSAMFFIPVKYQIKNKREILIMTVEMRIGKKFLSDTAFAEEYTANRLLQITGKKADSFSFPMGLKPWKINTVLTLDGMPVCITGSGSKGKCLHISTLTQFSAGKEWQFYVKKLEMLTEKATDNENYIYDAVYDKVTPEKNIELYDIYIDKLQNSVYRKRINNPVETLIKSREQFIRLSALQQAQTLLNIHLVFGRLSSGVDLTAIGSVAHAAATVNFSSSLSNWKKYYSDVRLLDQSPSGIWCSRSGNLLDLL